MTLEDLERMDKEALTPQEVAPLLNCHPYSINLAARDNPGRLGFPVIVMGTRVRIPRRAFIKFMQTGEVTC